MVTDGQLRELRGLLRRVTRGLWQRRRPGGELLALVGDNPRLTRRHVAVLAQIGGEGERTVGELARELGLSLPAASKLTRDLEDASLVRRREHVDDRRRTVVDLNALTSERVHEWLERRNRPLRRTLEALTPEEQDAFLKGLRTLADAPIQDTTYGALRPHHPAPHH